MSSRRAGRVSRAWAWATGPVRRAWRKYLAAAVDRLRGGWTASSNAANREIAASLPILRDRWRQLVRDNPHAARIVELRVGAIVGSGHTPRPMCVVPRAVAGGRPVTDAGANAAVMALWDRWSLECDAEGELDLAGLQTLAARAWQEGGDCLIRRRRRRASDGLAVPLQLQLLEGDYLDAASHDGISLPDGGRQVLGVEFDRLGRRRGYWLHRQHPGDVWLESIESVRVPAADVAHLYTADRPGQVRGVPCGSAVADQIRRLGDTEEAAGVKLRIESCLTAIVHYESAEDASLAGFDSADAARPATRIGPGMILHAPHSKSVSTVAPTSTSNADALMLRQLHACAVGSGVPYELLTGDLSQVNFSSIRAGLIEYRRQMRTLQRQQFEALLLRRVWSWFVEAAILFGALPEREGGYPCVWQAPRFEEVDRQTDATADSIQLAAGTTSFGRVAAEEGYDPEELLTDIARWRDRARELGLVLSWMPEGTTTPAVQQSQAGSAPRVPSVKPNGATA